MNRAEIVQSFKDIRVRKRKGVSAPHKPLLILYALGKLLRGEKRLISFSEVDEVLGSLLKEFGAKSSRQGTVFPFWRLQNDGVWEIPAAHKVRETSKGDALKGDLLKYDITGGIAKGIARQIRKDSVFMCKIISDMLEAHFPPHDHERILRAVGIEPIIWSNLRHGITNTFHKGADGKPKEYQNREVRQSAVVSENAERLEGEELIAQLNTRFPLISELIGQFGMDSPTERIPWFFAFLLSAATSQDRGACCFVLDKTLGTTAVIAVLLALKKLQEEFPEMAKKYAQSALSRGQRVKVNPSNYVYEYEGLWEEYPGRFRLKILGERSYRSFWMTEVLRLEPTDRLRPKGKLKSPLGSFERSHLDVLLGLSTCGNNSLFKNSVLLYMAQARFSKAADEMALALKTTRTFEYLSEFLPWGTIGPDGELRPFDAYQITGEPIIAASRVPEDLAVASTSAKTGTKVVLADGARGFARDLQAFHDIADQQRVVILASPEEAEALEMLEEQNCPIWYMSPEEILLGESFPSRRERKSFVGATVRAADTRRKAKTVVVECQNSSLQSVAETLERAAALVSDSEESDEADDILERLYGILLECSECCFGSPEETGVRLDEVQKLVRQQERWLDPSFAKEIDTVLHGLSKVISDGSFGQEKVEALLNIIESEQTESWAVVTRSPRTSESLRMGLKRYGFDAPVLPISTISPEREFSLVIVPAWPNGQKFSKLKNLAVTPDIRVLAYPFEAKWLSGHQARERRLDQSNRMKVEEQSSILGIDSRFLTFTQHQQPDSPAIETEAELPISRFEDRVARRRIMRPAAAREGEESREAQLVQFLGDCYTLLTEWAELPKLNNLIDKANTDDSGLEHVRVSRLVPGDYVLFRASEDKEFIRQIAEDILGLEEYEKTRATAERWRSSLRLLGNSPADVQQVLESFGLTRTKATVSAWLHNPYHIGPGDFGDIEVIARAAGDTKLLSIREEVEDAITHIRSTHINAGRKLTQLILGELGGHLSNLDDEPVLLDLEYGEAWVVQVDKIDFERRNYPASSVNRLLWADEVTS